MSSQSREAILLRTEGVLSVGNTAELHARAGELLEASAAICRHVVLVSIDPAFPDSRMAAVGLTYGGTTAISPRQEHESLEQLYGRALEEIGVAGEQAVGIEAERVGIDAQLAHGINAIGLRRADSREWLTDDDRSNPQVKVVSGYEDLLRVLPLIVQNRRHIG